jgi:hypothetical protein
MTPGRCYRPVHGWEQLTRTAPSPTGTNSKDKPRLAAPFSEWMMGWPAGWVTDTVCVSRNDKVNADAAHTREDAQTYTASSFNPSTACSVSSKHNRCVST